MAKTPLALSLGAAALAAAAAVAFRVKRSKRDEIDELPVYVLRNANGLEVHISPVGGAILKLLVPGQDGKEPVDVVLGWDRPSEYMRTVNTPYFGALVGRCANRIANARFSIDDHEYTLEANNGPNALHGGRLGLHKRVWEARQEATEAGEAVVLKYTSPDGEEGYPGNLTIIAMYELPTNVDELRITITAVTDKPTPVNIVQHSYFNLAGHASGTILNHTLRLKGDHYTPVDANTIPTGEILPVAGTPFDFTEPHAIGERIGQVEGGYDHNYVLFGMGNQARFITNHGMAATTPRLAATVTHPASGRTLEVLTSAPGVQLYTGNFLEGTKGKGGVRYGKHAGLCLETQAFPNSINTPSFPDVVIKPGEMYKHQLVYKFKYSSS